MYDAVPNLERIELLCQALESDRYVQGSGALRYNGKHCCLGVACDIADPKGWRRNLEGDTTHEWKFDTEVGYLSMRVVNWYGFNAVDDGTNWIGNPKLQTDTGTWVTMTQLNDTYGYSFAAIAKALRRTYLPRTIKTEEEDVVKT